jgi:lipopolysaccharide export system permease protein
VRRLDRYLLQQFLQALLLGLLAFLVIFIVIDFFEKLGDYIDRGTPWLVVLRLYLFKIPYITVLILPIAMLLASLFSLGRLSRDNELTAMLAAGVPLPRLLMPLFVFAALVSVGSYYFNDRVVTHSNLALEQLQKYEVRQEPQADRGVRRFVHRIGEDGTLYWAEAYFVTQQRFENLVLLRYDGSRLREYTVARHAFWNGNHWRLVEGTRHLFPDGAGQARPESGSFSFENLDLPPLAETPEVFSEEEKKPEAMDYRELQDYIATQTRSGEDADRLWVDLHVKASFPWANLVIVLLGSALSASKRRISMAAGFGLTVAIAFVYLIFLRLGLSLGHNHTLPPLLAAWVGNLLFAVVGMALLWRASR